MDFDDEEGLVADDESRDASVLQDSEMDDEDDGLDYGIPESAVTETAPVRDGILNLNANGLDEDRGPADMQQNDAGASMRKCGLFKWLIF